MAAMNYGLPLGNLLGLGQLAGGLQQQQLQQNQWAATWNATNTSNVVNPYVVTATPVESVPVKAKGPETALEWLDRRVNEIRLPLAA